MTHQPLLTSYNYYYFLHYTSIHITPNIIFLSHHYYSILPKKNLEKTRGRYCTPFLLLSERPFIDFEEFVSIKIDTWFAAADKYKQLSFIPVGFCHYWHNSRGRQQLHMEVLRTFFCDFAIWGSPRPVHFVDSFDGQIMSIEPEYCHIVLLHNGAECKLLSHNGLSAGYHRIWPRLGAFSLKVVRLYRSIYYLFIFTSIVSHQKKNNITKGGVLYPSLYMCILI